MNTPVEPSNTGKEQRFFHYKNTGYSVERDGTVDIPGVYCFETGLDDDFSDPHKYAEELIDTWYNSGFPSDHLTLWSEESVDKDFSAKRVFEFPYGSGMRGMRARFVEIYARTVDSCINYAWSIPVDGACSDFRFSSIDEAVQAAKLFIDYVDRLKETKKRSEPALKEPEPIAEANPVPSALNEQVGEQHYKNMAIQPAVFCQKNRLTFCESSVIKYVCRHRNKNGRQDIEKAIHFLKLLLEIEYAEPTPPSTPS